MPSILVWRTRGRSGNSHGKAVGFNTIRVHAVVMGEAFYAMCDKIGLLVFQAVRAASPLAL